MQDIGLNPMANAELRTAIAMFRSFKAQGYTDEAAVEAIERVLPGLRARDIDAGPRQRVEGRMNAGMPTKLLSRPSGSET